MRIGFFDSGHGGLDILQQAMMSVGADYFFIADSRFHPYGALKIDDLIKRCHQLTRMLVEDQGCEVIVVACNTATVYAIDSLRQEFQVPFVGVEPYLNYINHAERALVKKGSVGALVTPNTMKSERFHGLKQQKDPDDLVHVMALPQLAPAIEAFVKDRNELQFQVKLQEMIEGLNFDQWQETILGCTHYPLVQKHLEKALNTKCITPTPAIIRQLKRVLQEGRFDTLKTDYKDLSFQYWDTQTDDWQQADLSTFLPLPGE